MLAQEERKQEDTDWLCKYEVLEPLLLHLVTKSRVTALVVGSGTSTFPEQLYDRGVKEVVVVDASAEAMEVVSARNKHAGRTGLTCVVGDIASPQPPKLPNPELLYDFVIDKGTLDLLLITEDGWERAHVALKWMYEQLRTPGSLFYISHSPPHDRVAMLTSVYWHDAQFKMIEATTVAELVANTPYREKLLDYPWAVEGWEEQQSKRLAAAAKAGVALSFQPKEGVEGTAAYIPPQRPAGDLGFAANTAYIYVLEK